MVTMLAGIIGVAVMLMPGSLIRRKQIALDDRQRFEAHLLAGDILEIGKYFLLYERVMFTGNPLHLEEGGGGGMTRGECLRSVWGQSYGTFRVGEGNLKDACGITGANGSYQGSLALTCGGASSASQRTFCPGLIRDPNLSGEMFESMRFIQWVDKGLMTTTAARPGVYSLTINLTKALDPGEQGKLFVRMFHGQKFLVEMFRGAGLLTPPPMTAELIYDFYTGAAGFQSSLSERYVKVTGRITFKGARKAGHFVERSETMMMLPTTPRDFVFFMPFPDKTAALVVPSNTNNPTTLFSESMKISSGAEIFGRTYFNGDIDTPLDDLPVFEGAVALSGNIKRGGVVPGPADLPLLKQKFKKGFITHLSAARFMMDGECAGDGAPGPGTTPIRVSNGTGFECNDPGGSGPFGIVNYIPKISGCWKFNLTVNGATRSDDTTSCPAPVSPVATMEFATGGYLEITAEGTYSPIMSPVKRLTVIGSPNVYGTILGGQVLAPNGRPKFYSVSSLQRGLSGVSTNDILEAANASATISYQGISVAVPNLPVVLITGEEAK